MPPHHHHRRPGRALGASVAGIINSDVSSDEQAKRRVLRLFGSVLGVVFFIDLLCSFSVVVLSCRHYHYHYDQHYDNDNDNDHDHDLDHEAYNHDHEAYHQKHDDPFRSALSESSLFGQFFSSSSQSLSPSSTLSPMNNFSNTTTTTTTTATTTTSSSSSTTTTTTVSGNNSVVGQCVRTSIMKGFITFRPIVADNDNDNDNDNNNNDNKHSTGRRNDETTLGDLFALSVTRCILFVSLLMVGIKYGGGGSGSGSGSDSSGNERDDENNNNNNNNNNNSSDDIRNEGQEEEEENVDDVDRTTATGTSTSLPGSTTTAPGDDDDDDDGTMTRRRRTRRTMISSLTTTENDDSDINNDNDDDDDDDDDDDEDDDNVPAVFLSRRRQTTTGRTSSNSNNSNSNSNNDLTEPLLLLSGTDNDDDEEEEETGDGDDDRNDSDGDDHHDHDDRIGSFSNAVTCWFRRIFCCCCSWVTNETKLPSSLQPNNQQLQTFIVVMLFVLCTYYQVYAGLKVATLVHPATESIVPLLCLTVLWINVESYIFRTLLDELTREDGLYLPPEVHRHPMYLVKSRNVSVHWCDLCHRPIGGKKKSHSEQQASSSGNNSSSNRNSGDDHNNSCYRCALCDFDVCMKCARRKDAATVGENILRTDSGARVEQSMTTSGYVKRSIQVARSELPLILISFLLLGATSISRLLLPDFQGRIIDKVIPDPETGEYDRHGFQRFIKIYVLVMVAQATLLTLYSAILTLVSRRLKFTLRNALLEKILIQDVAYFDGTESGRLISRLTNDLDLMMAPIQSSLSSLLSNVLILFGGLAMCFVKSYRLSMISFITIGPISALWEQYAHWSKGLAREMLSYWGEGNSIASQVLSHIRTVKAFGCEQKVLQKYSDINEHALHCGVKDAWGNALTTALTGLLDLGSGVLILWFGGLLVFRGELSVGELVTFQLFWNMMNNAFQNLQSLITSFTRSAAGAEKVFSMWDSYPDIDPNQGLNIDWNVEGHIQLKNVKFFYQMRPDNIVLKDFSLDIPAGKTLALVGRSGGGKSTIINLLLRFYDPREGKLVLDGRDYNSIKVDQLRRLFGVVTQETELFALTVEENIAYGLDKDEYTMDDVIEAAKKSYAHDFISEMKDGYQTRIGERGNRLSGGQRQRLAIARVFLRKPKLILLDEATSALDENSQEAVQKALANLIEESQATVVLVAHRLSTVVNADSICVIDKGSVLEQGNHDELVAHGGIYASMVKKQLRKKEDVLDQDGKKNHGGGNKKNNNTSDDDIDALLDETSNK